MKPAAGLVLLREADVSIKKPLKLKYWHRQRTTNIRHKTCHKEALRSSCSFKVKNAAQIQTHQVSVSEPQMVIKTHILSSLLSCRNKRIFAVVMFKALEPETLYNTLLTISSQSSQSYKSDCLILPLCVTRPNRAQDRDRDHGEPKGAGVWRDTRVSKQGGSLTGLCNKSELRSRSTEKHTNRGCRVV